MIGGMQNAVESRGEKKTRSINSRANIEWLRGFSETFGPILIPESAAKRFLAAFKSVSHAR
jgi:hypothetical protein